MIANQDAIQTIFWMKSNQYLTHNSHCDTLYYSHQLVRNLWLSLGLAKWIFYYVVNFFAISNDVYKELFHFSHIIKTFLWKTYPEQFQVSHYLLNRTGFLAKNQKISWFPLNQNQDLNYFDERADSKLIRKEIDKRLLLV